MSRLLLVVMVAAFVVFIAMFLTYRALAKRADHQREIERRKLERRWEEDDRLYGYDEIDEQLERDRRDR